MSPISEASSFQAESHEAPRKSPHPDDPFAGMLFIPILALASVCLLFVLYRRASSLRYVVGNQLKTWTNREGRIRLSEDDGPSAQSFVVNDPPNLVDEEDIAAPFQKPQSPTRTLV